MRFRPDLEALESRLVPYSVSNAWPTHSVSVSLVPDGTKIIDITDSYNLEGSVGAEALKGDVAWALAKWAEVADCGYAGR